MPGFQIFSVPIAISRRRRIPLHRPAPTPGQPRRAARLAPAAAAVAMISALALMLAGCSTPPPPPPRRRRGKLK